LPKQKCVAPRLTAGCIRAAQYRWVDRVWRTKYSEFQSITWYINHHPSSYRKETTNGRTFSEVNWCNTHTHQTTLFLEVNDFVFLKIYESITEKVSYMYHHKCTSHKLALNISLSLSFWWTSLTKRLM
jgi:hypothetical protein